MNFTNLSKMFFTNTKNEKENIKNLNKKKLRNIIRERNFTTKNYEKLENKEIPSYKNSFDNSIKLIYIGYPKDTQLYLLNPKTQIIIKKNYFCIGKLNCFFKQDLIIGNKEVFFSPKQLEIYKINYNYYLQCNGINTLCKISLNLKEKFLLINDSLFNLKKNKKKIFFFMSMKNECDYLNKNTFEIKKINYYDNTYNYDENKESQAEINIIDYKNNEILESINLKENKNYIKYLDFEFEINKLDNNKWIIERKNNDIEILFFLKSFKRYKNNLKSEKILIDKSYDLEIGYHKFNINKN